MSQHIRPRRFTINDFQGRACTLAEGVQAFSRLYAPKIPQARIFFGISPHMQSLVLHDGAHAHMPTYYIVDEAFLCALPELQGHIPSHWQRLNMQEALPLLLHSEIWWYDLNLRLSPNFWEPLWGSIHARILRGLGNFSPMPNNSKNILIYGHEGQLIHKEVCTAFTELGYKVHTPNDSASLHTLLQELDFSLFFSINGRGLLEDGGEGKIFSLLKALGMRIACWFVDNPWHVLSAAKGPWWKKAKLFVTDISFVSVLQQAGADHVFHLPLAVAQHMWELPKKTAPAHMSASIGAAQKAPCTFVGRASFPDKEKFFAAAKIPQNIWALAMQMLEQEKSPMLPTGALLPHFAWWAEQMGLQAKDLWPGSVVRSVGLGAENCAMQQRALWLQALLPLEPAIFGDMEGWQVLLPKAKAQLFQSHLDYYTELPHIYAYAQSVLNVTSLLLPKGLTQRHFDVWAAGGFLFTSYTKGLDIFPKELVKPVALTAPQALSQALKSVSPSFRQELILAWQEILRAEHSYAKRMAFILEACAE